MATFPPQPATSMIRLFTYDRGAPHLLAAKFVARLGEALGQISRLAGVSTRLIFEVTWRQNASLTLKLSSCIGVAAAACTLFLRLPHHGRQHRLGDVHIYLVEGRFSSTRLQVPIDIVDYLVLCQALFLVLFAKQVASRVKLRQKFLGAHVAEPGVSGDMDGQQKPMRRSQRLQQQIFQISSPDTVGCQPVQSGIGVRATARHIAMYCLHGLSGVGRTLI